MMSKQTLKEIISSNEEFILNHVRGIIKRERISPPGSLNKVVVFYGIRRSYDVFYFAENGECDFIARSDENKLLPIQVCYELNQKNREREINGLIEACRTLGVSAGTILTFDDEEEMDAEGIYIQVLPAWRWIAEPR